eukprot:795843-Amphidinium_carterae.2
MAHGESIPQQPVDIATKVEKSGQDTSRQAEADNMTSVLAQPTLVKDRLAGMEQLDARALRDAITASAGAVKIVQDMMSDRRSSTRDAENLTENSEELMARATSRKREEQGALPDGQTKVPRVNTSDELTSSTKEPEGSRDGKIVEMIIVLPSTDHRPSGDDGRGKESLGGLQQPAGERQTPGVAERRPDLTNSEVTTKLYPDSERRQEASCSPVREARGSNRPVQENTGQRREHDNGNAAPTRAVYKEL